MGITGWLKNRVTNLLTQPLEEMGSWARFVRTQIQLWRHCARRLHSNNAMAMSAALSFRTIFTIVPVLVLAFLILKPLGGVEHGKEAMRRLLDEAGLTEIVHQETAEAAPAGTTQLAEVPDAGSVNPSPPRRLSVADKIEELVAKAEKKLTLGSLGPVGAVLLIWTAITLLTTIERSLNRIFDVPRSRPLVRRVFLYWSVLTLGPVLAVGALFLAGRAIAAVQMFPLFSTVVTTINWVLGFGLGVLLLASLYSQVPNTHVLYRSAIVGALAAVPLWLLARWGFFVYIRQVGTRNFYGALALVPLFLMWLNLSWWIFLFGAQLAHSVSHLGRLRRLERAEHPILGPWDFLATILAVARRQSAGRGPVDLDRVADALNLRGEDAERLLSRLCESGMICRVADGQRRAYVLVHQPQGVAVTDVLRLGGRGAGEASGDRELFGQVSGLRRVVEDSVRNVTLADILKNEPSPAEGTDVEQAN